MVAIHQGTDRRRFCFFDSFGVYLSEGLSAAANFILPKRALLFWR
jgi:hypothetical protein